MFYISGYRYINACYINVSAIFRKVTYNRRKVTYNRGKLVWIENGHVQRDSKYSYMNIGIIVYSDNNIVLEKYIDARMNTYHTSALFISIIIPRMICVPHWKRKYRYLLPCTVFAIFRTFSNRFSPTKSRHTLYWEPQGFPLQGVSDFIFFSKNTKYFCPIQDSPCIGYRPVHQV